MTDLNAGLEFGFLSSLVNISFPLGGLITVELLSGTPANYGADQSITITSWSSNAPLPNYNTQLPDARFPGTFALATIASFIDGTFPANGQPSPTGLDFGGVGSTGGRGAFFGTGLLNALSGTQVLSKTLLGSAFTWPQPYGMMTQNGNLATDLQQGAIFFSLKALQSTPFEMVLNWNTGGPAPLSGTVLISYYSAAPKSFSLRNIFPLLVPLNGVQPESQAIFDVPFVSVGPYGYNITVKVAKNDMTATSVPQ